jgi:NADH:ubiquinone oxidoreductase subunit 6 (subunit J)
MFYYIPSSFIYYISGIFVAVSVNLITANPVDIFNTSGNNTLIFNSIPWFACATFLTIFAIFLERAENDYANKQLINLSSDECKELKKSIYKRYSLKFIICLLIIIVSFIIGVYFSISKAKDINTVEPSQAKITIPKKCSSACKIQFTA